MPQNAPPPSLAARALLAGVQFYRRRLSPLKPPVCRFYPTCSAYALVAIERFGAARGSLLATARVARCHPLHPGGFDPVPTQWSWAALRGQPRSQTDQQRFGQELLADLEKHQREQQHKQ
jgi:uncharacterized protein